MASRARAEPLFPLPARPPGATALAVTAFLAERETDEAAAPLDPVAVALLRAACQGIDLATERGDPWQIAAAVREARELHRTLIARDRHTDQDAFTHQLEDLLRPSDQRPAVG